MPKAPAEPEVHYEMAPLDATADAALGRALTRTCAAIEDVRAKLSAGTASNSEREWARVMAQASAGLLARATVPDLASYLLSLAQHHGERMTATRREREEDARARGQTVDYVDRLPVGEAEIADHMQGKRNPRRLVVDDRDAAARGALMREAMVALDARFAGIDFESILTTRPKQDQDPPPRGPVPLVDNVTKELASVGLKVSRKQLKL